MQGFDRNEWREESIDRSTHPIERRIASIPIISSIKKPFGRPQSSAFQPPPERAHPQTLQFPTPNPIPNHPNNPYHPQHPNKHYSTLTSCRGPARRRGGGTQAWPASAGGSRGRGPPCLPFLMRWFDFEGVDGETCGGLVCVRRQGSIGRFIGRTPSCMRQEVRWDDGRRRLLSPTSHPIQPTQSHQFSIDRSTGRSDRSIRPGVGVGWIGGVGRRQSWQMILVFDVCPPGLDTLRGCWVLGWSGLSPADNKGTHTEEASTTCLFSERSICPWGAIGCCFVLASIGTVCPLSVCGFWTGLGRPLIPVEEGRRLIRLARLAWPAPGFDTVAHFPHFPTFLHPHRTPPPLPGAATRRTSAMDVPS